MAATATVAKSDGVAASGDGVNGSNIRLCEYLSPISAGRSVKSAGSHHAIANAAHDASRIRSRRVERPIMLSAARKSASHSLRTWCQIAIPHAAPRTSAATSRIDGVRPDTNACAHSTMPLNMIAAISVITAAEKGAVPLFASDSSRKGVRPLFRGSSAADMNRPIGRKSRTFDTRSVSDNEPASAPKRPQNSWVAVSSGTA